MRYRFNQQAAIWTFTGVVVAFVIAIGVNRFGNEKEIPLLGMLIYWILGLFAIIFTGLMVQKKKKKISVD